LSILLNKGSQIFIRNSEEKFTVASPTDCPAPKFVIFLKLLVNHIPKVGSLLSCIDLYPNEFFGNLDLFWKNPIHSLFVDQSIQMFL
jgi:hypothetical protein